MSPFRLLLPAMLLAFIAVPASAASFDCARAATPFEHAICDMPELSAADDLLAKSFATATGGLTKGAVGLMRADQRNWLDYAGRACTDDAQAMTSGRYDENGGACLVEKFNTRSRALEQSRMIDGHRFFLQSVYAALPDPYEADNPDSYWKVASHELVMPQLDSDDPLAAGFNRFVTERAAALSDIPLPEGGDTDQPDASSDTSVVIKVKDLGGSNRITMDVSTYWYGHGAAHGNWSVSYLHYLADQGRGLIASDVFAGDDWATILADAAWAAVQAQHADWLQAETAGDIAEIVVEPSRWDLSSDYGLTIQFQPYEISAYAYGAPTITIPWDRLDAIKAETQDAVRYGY